MKFLDGAMATGVIARRDNKCTTDCDIVTNMRNAGGILLCLTNTSEFCMWLESRNPLYGITNNPYNLSRQFNFCLVFSVIITDIFKKNEFYRIVGNVHFSI